jgi:predicted TIM-barrel fold metal-dependent hydrolase
VPTLEELERNREFTRARPGQVTFLPEPEPEQQHFVVISVDDHIVEPPHTFKGRVPKHLADRAPHVEERDGAHVWCYDGVEIPNVGFNAVVGRPVSEYGFEPTRFEHMRRGAYDIEARIADMDLCGVLASLNFPSFLPGFAGQRLQLTTKDPELALACVRAWNDWHAEEWAGAHPDRIIPCQIPYLLDPEVGAAEIRRNAARGFKAVSFTEAPHLLGLPSLHTGHFDPIFAACAETETVVNLHVGSSSSSPGTAPDAPPDTVGVLFFAYAMFAAVDWLFSKVAVRYPDLRICLSEGGIGWVAGLLDRLDHMDSYASMYGTWEGIELTPAEVLQRNFWFCALEDPTSFKVADRIGVDHILVEVDYPHCDSIWPHVQRTLAEQLSALRPPDQEKVTWANAAALYRHPVPAELVAGRPGVAAGPPLP